MSMRKYKAMLLKCNERKLLRLLLKVITLLVVIGILPLTSLRYQFKKGLFFFNKKDPVTNVCTIY